MSTSDGRTVNDDAVIDGVVGANGDEGRAINTNVIVDILGIAVGLEIDGVKVRGAVVRLLKVEEGGRSTLIDVNPEKTSGLKLCDLNGEGTGNGGHLKLVIVPLIEGDVCLTRDSVGEMIEGRRTIFTGKTGITIAAAGL